MTNVWTHGRWTVKPGREEEFVREWRALARAALAEIDGLGAPTLLRDRADSSVFIAFGPWPSMEALERFRASAALRERAPVLDGLIEEGEARVLDEVGLD